MQHPIPEPCLCAGVMKHVTLSGKDEQKVLIRWNGGKFGATCLQGVMAQGRG